MTVYLNNGDYLPDGCGGVCRAEGADALVQEAMFRLSCRRGAFPLLPELGSRLHLLGCEKPSARDAAARQYAAEALEGLPVTVEDVFLTAAGGDLAVRVSLRSTDKADTVEVKI